MQITPNINMNAPSHQKSSYLLGLIGTNIQTSRTPAMHEYEGKQQGLHVFYQLIDLYQLNLNEDALPQLLQAALYMGFSGLNITHPCKQAILPFLDDISEDAHALGAVNTLTIRNGRLIGYNTDWWGFYEGFKRGFPDVEKTSVVQLGAGGAGSAVAYALMKLGVEKLYLYDTIPQKAYMLASRLNTLFGSERFYACEDLSNVMAKANGLVHCTPQGMEKYPGLPLPKEFLFPKLWIAEIVYFPLETALLKTARSIGCQTLDGSNMAVFQAVGAFELFTGIKPDAKRMIDFFHAMSN